VSVAVDAEPATQFGGVHGRQSQAPIPVVGVGGKDPAGGPSERGGRKVGTLDTPYVAPHLSASGVVKTAD
jgi:hypothetical protein